ncbi:LCP family protein [Paractinoplanes lichenicola]|uniref:LCP family protein n=1 Tax=Paractinoplanes lichenicola TaxID=2802976 RepID=A0ABS1VSL4_9ACTN|nr:LCP family protein [Actinoplanes lichenicola]MBL7256981.1 LCP family protein [Actinoplanes lichenicola]
MRNKRAGLWIGGALAVALLAGGGIAWAVRSGPDKPTAAPSAPTTTPPPAPTSPAPSPGADITGPLDLVLIGVDTRVSIPTWEPHADAIMLLHVEPGLGAAYLYSIPRDTRVAVPGHGTRKVTEAMSLGSRVAGSKVPDVEKGYELLTRTLSGYTGIKQFQAGAILNFGGLARLTDQLGGVDLVIDQKVASRHRKPDGSLRPLSGGEYTGPQAVYQPGRRHLVGWQATDYARQRYGLPDGDYDRQRHQRQLVAALLTKAMGQGLPTQSEKVDQLVAALGDTFVYLGGRKPVEYAYALRDLSPSKITRVSLPGRGVGRGSGYLGEQLTEEGRGFVRAVAQGKAGAYLKSHPKLVDK